MKIGTMGKYFDLSYPYERCILNICDNVEYVDVIKDDNYKGLSGILVRLLIKMGLLKHKKNCEVWKSNKVYDCVHFFNTVYEGEGKWCVTFEEGLPRNNEIVMRPWTYTDYSSIDNDTKYLISLMEKDNCIAVFALSQYAYDIQKWIFDKYNANANVYKKMRVLHPPQALIMSEDEVRKKHIKSDVIEIIFVGNDFFRKGGHLLVDVLNELPDKSKFHLTVISNLRYNDYITKVSAEKSQEYKDKMASLQWITHYSSLGNEEVLELCKSAHIGTLPTLDDTYGFSVLEMQAAGCAMITTDINALAELNNDNTGWLIHIEKNEFREARIGTPEELLYCMSSIKEQLTKIFTKVLENKDIIGVKGLCAFRRIAEEHNKVEYAKELYSVYKNCI